MTYEAVGGECSAYADDGPDERHDATCRTIMAATLLGFAPRASRTIDLACSLVEGHDAVDAQQQRNTCGDHEQDHRERRLHRCTGPWVSWVTSRIRRDKARASRRHSECHSMDRNASTRIAPCGAATLSPKLRLSQVGRSISVHSNRRINQTQISFMSKTATSFPGQVRSVFETTPS